MALTARQTNKHRKDGNPPPSNGNRRGAWRGGPPHSVQTNRSNIGPSSPVGPAAVQTPLKGIETALNSNVVVILRNGSRHTGNVASVDPDHSGFTLKNYKDVGVPTMVERESMYFPAVQLHNWMYRDPINQNPPSQQNQAPATPLVNGNGNGSLPHPQGFRTDTDISQNAKVPRERQLQAWSDEPSPHTTPSPPATRGDELTFGSLSGPWDQFAVNQQKFGITTDYDEELYTTKLDRSRADYKERERDASRIANEIENSMSSNPHIAEERNVAGDDSGANEEDKYGAVVRGPHAYVPPGARASVAVAASRTTSSATAGTSETPKAASPDPVSSAAVPTLPSEHNVVGSFREFVVSEKQRLVQKKLQIVKKEKDSRIADLVKFSKEFKLNRPIPDDLVSILAKDEDKQKALVEKSKQEATTAGARSIATQIKVANAAASPSKPSIDRRAPQPIIPQGVVAAANPTAAKFAIKTAQYAAAHGLNAAGTSNASTTNTANSTASAVTAAPPVAATSSSPSPASGSSAARIYIQKIPPYKGKRTETIHAVNGSSSADDGANAKGADGSSSASPSSTTSPSFKLNVKATSFKPNPNASAFKPVSASASPSSAPTNLRQDTPKPDTPPVDHPFFGKTLIKLNPVHIKDEFNPFRNNKVPEAFTITQSWPFTGKKFMHFFPSPQNQQPAAVLSPPPPSQQQQPPPPPPPQPPLGHPPTGPYGDDPAAVQQQLAAATAAGYHPMMYFPYPYAGQQPIMPLPGHPSAPAGYIPGPYMQPMHLNYPPPQANGHPMYAGPPMNGMPAPGYIPQQPQPAPYPPNGGAQRGSMPPTPMPQHAYAFQSPQPPHAVAYPMMMGQPPPSQSQSQSGPPPSHNYDAQAQTPGGGAPSGPINGH